MNQSLSLSLPLLEATFSPLPLEEFKTYFLKSKCLVLEGARDKFESLVSPSDIERRLNDGCNASAFVQIIKDGSRSSLLNHSSAWAPAALDKSAFIESLSEGNSFMMANSSQITQPIARFCDELESFCSPLVSNAMCADVHLYVSMRENGNSYNIHRDFPQHKILMQAHGDTHWQIFSTKKEIAANIQAFNDDEALDCLELESEFTLSQGDLLYMPPGTFHRVTGTAGPRISISVPFFASPHAQRMDRQHIPFCRLFDPQSA